MHQQPYPAYIPQQWPIPPLWNTDANWPWFNSTMAAPQHSPSQAEWHWRAQNVQNGQPHAQFPHSYHHAGTVGQLEAAPNTGARVQIQRPALPAAPTQAPPRPTMIAKPAAVVTAAGMRSTGTNLNTSESVTPILQAVKGRDRSDRLNTESPASLAASERVSPAQSQLVAPPAEPLTTVGQQPAPSGKRPSRRGQGNTCVTRGELCALEALTRIFPGKVFEKVRPDWLINDRTNKALEIDLYNHELRLGLEHNGQSHYVFPNSLHKTREEFDAQVYRDKLKQSLSAKAGVLLVHVPFTVPHAAMETYIRGEIDRLSDDSASDN